MQLFRVKPDRIDVGPVAHCAAAPAGRMGLFGSFVDGRTVSQNLSVKAGMTLSGRDEADPAVTMLRVVPGNEALHPGTGLIDIAEALPRVWQCSKPSKDRPACTC